MSKKSTCRACSFYGQGGKSRTAIPHTCGKTYDERVAALAKMDELVGDFHNRQKSNEQIVYEAYCKKKGIESQVEFLADNIVTVPLSGFVESEATAIVLFGKIPMYYKNSRPRAKVDFTFSDGLCTFIFFSCR